MSRATDIEQERESAPQAPAHVAEPMGVPADGHDVICISSIDWKEHIWQGHQEIMATLAQRGSRVLFIENTGIRAPTWRDLPRLRQRLLNWWHSTRGFRMERENLYLYAPCILPFPYSRVARWINRWWIMRDLRQWMNATGFGRPVVWTFLPTRLAADIIRAVNPKTSVYYCIDNLAGSSKGARRITRSEQEMFRLVDTVFTTSLNLYEYASATARDVHLFPFGVKFETFEAWRRRPDPDVLADVEAIPSPRIGYVGGIHRWLDQELLCQVADTHPEWSLVMVGPIQTDVSRLRRRRNIHLLAGKAHELLPGYIERFNVAIIPYAITPYTQCVYPTKTNEYFAMGKSVVSTPLREILGFNQRHGGCIRTAGDAAGFGAAIAEALAAGDRDAERRIGISRENSWSRRITQMQDLISERILARQRERALNWQRVLAGFLGRTQLGLLKLCGAILVGFLLVFETPLVWVLGEPLKLAATPRAVDAIVVFGGGVGESGQAGQGHEERLTHAVRLYQAGYADQLVFSTGFRRVFPEAEVMRALAISRGVPAEAIILEAAAASTYENVLFTSRLLQEQGASSMLLVSSPYHMRRAMLVVDKQAPWLDAVPAPVEESRFYAHGWGASPQQVRGLLHEYLAIVYYWWKRWI